MSQHLSNDFRFVRLGENPIDIQFTTARACGNFFIEHLASLSDKVMRFENALKSIADNGCCDKCQEAALVAKNALSTAST